MKALHALEEFKDLVHQSSKSLEHLSPEDAVKLMVIFYSEVRAEGCNLKDNGDMLLFQWGTYNWGTGEFFEYDITRQFIFPETLQNSEDNWKEDAIWQLSLTLKFRPSPELKEIGCGSQWCEAPDEVFDFVQFIESCKATEGVRFRIPEIVDLTFENAE